MIFCCIFIMIAYLYSSPYIPKHHRVLCSFTDGHGMPSSHAQFMFFFFTYMVLWLFSGNVSFLSNNPSLKFSYISQSRSTTSSSTSIEASSTRKSLESSAQIDHTSDVKKSSTNIHGSKCKASTERNFRLFLAICAWMLSAFVCHSRVQLGVHSLKQILVGVTFGTLFGLVWHVFGQSVVRCTVFPWIESTSVAQALYIRDR
jgi:hypothetical protein